MPKPFANLTGSGSHAHISLWDASTGSCVSGGGEPAMHALSRPSLRLGLGGIGLGLGLGIAPWSNPSDAVTTTWGAWLG